MATKLSNLKALKEWPPAKKQHHLKMMCLSHTTVCQLLGQLIVRAEHSLGALGLAYQVLSFRPVGVKSNCPLARPSCLVFLMNVPHEEA